MTAIATRISARRVRRDRTMRALIALAISLAVAPLVWIVFDVVKAGVGAIHSATFFTSASPGSPDSTGGGIAEGIVGTLVMTGLAAAMAIPLGVLGAVYLTEFARGSLLSRSVRFFADVMTGIPSILVGLFVYLAVVLTTPWRFSGFAGSVALAVIMWPVVLRSAQEMLLLVPRDVREAALALGVPRGRTIVRVILPTAGPGMVTGVMLAVGRAAGETAPLLFTAFGNNQISTNIAGPMHALPLIIYQGATSAFAAFNSRAWGAAFTLIVLVMTLTLGGRALANRRAGRAA